LNSISAKFATHIAQAMMVLLVPHLQFYILAIIVNQNMAQKVIAILVLALMIITPLILVVIA
jgi:hypothetical protein